MFKILTIDHRNLFLHLRGQLNRSVTDKNMCRWEDHFDRFPFVDLLDILFCEIFKVVSVRVSLLF